MKKPKAAAAKETPSTGLAADAAAIMKLIDHAKAQGIAYFEGPQGLKFGFRREATKEPLLRQAKEAGDDFIP